MPKDGDFKSKEEPAAAVAVSNNGSSQRKTPDLALGPRIPRLSSKPRHLRHPASSEASNKAVQGASATSETHETRGRQSAVSPTAPLPSPSAKQGPPGGATSPLKLGGEDPQPTHPPADYNKNLHEYGTPPYRLDTDYKPDPSEHTAFAPSKLEYAKSSVKRSSSPIPSDGEDSQDTYCESLDRPDLSTRQTQPRSPATPPGLFTRPLTVDARAYDGNGKLRADVLPGSVSAVRYKRPIHFNPFTYGEVYVQKHERLENMYHGAGLTIPWMGRVDASRGQTLRAHPCFKHYSVHLDKMVGSGQYGSVFYGESPTGKPIALKKIEWDYAHDFSRHGFPLTAVREIKILKLINHQNVVRLMDVVTSPPKPGHQHQCKPFEIWMVMERAQHDLSGLIHGMEKGNIPRFSEAEFKSVCKQILEGTHYLHSSPKIKILHRDFKPSNILLTTDGEVKICDFGLARRYKSSKALTNEGRVISRWYRSPEILLGSKRYGPAVDIWSIGCIFAEMLRLKPAFPAQQEILQLTYIMEVCGSYNDQNWPSWRDHDLRKGSVPTPRAQPRIVQKHFSKYIEKQNWRGLTDPSSHPLLKVIDATLILDPSKRFKASQLLKMDYFKVRPAPVRPKFRAGDDHHEFRYDTRPGQKHWMKRMEKEREARKRQLEERASGKPPPPKPRPVAKVPPQIKIENAFEAQFGGPANKRKPRRPQHNDRGRQQHASQMRQPMKTGPRQHGQHPPKRHHGQQGFARPHPRPGRHRGPSHPNPFNPDDPGPPRNPQHRADPGPPRNPQHRAHAPRHHQSHGYGPVPGNRRAKAPQRAQYDPRHARQSSPPGHRQQPYHQPYGPSVGRHPVGAPYNTGTRRAHHSDHGNQWRNPVPRPEPNHGQRRRAEPNHGQNHQRNPPGSSREGYGDRRDGGRRQRGHGSERRGHGQRGHEQGGRSINPYMHSEAELDYGLGGGY